MADTYITTKVKFEDLEKKLNRLFRKISAVGGSYEFRKVGEFVRNVPVYAEDPENGRTVKVDDANVECVEFFLEFDPYIVGDYRVGCVLEKTDGDNLIYPIDDTMDFMKYKNTPLRCDHCGTRHNRRRAVVLIDNNTGDEIMVGTACLKDFTGYDVGTFANYICDIESILLENREPWIIDSEFGRYSQVLDTTTYLAYCIKNIDTYGYRRDVTKYEAAKDYFHKAPLSNKYLDKAQEVVDFFENYDADDTFENDTKILVTGKKPIYDANGFIAYAFILYQKIQEKIERENARKLQIAESEFYGEVGEKITVRVTGVVAGSYDTQYGTIYINKFTDTNGHTFIWKTGSPAGIFVPTSVPGREDWVPIQECGEVTLKGTVKDHNEFRGEKQTILTRCKITR